MTSPPIAAPSRQDGRHQGSGRLIYMTFVLGSLFAVHMVGLVRAIDSTLVAPAGASLGDAWFIFVEAAYSGFVTRMLFGLYRKTMDQAQLDDCSLVVFGIFLPAFNLTAALHLPGFSGGRSWTPFLAVNLLLAALGGLPAAHTLLAWMLSAPFIM